MKFLNKALVLAVGADAYVKLKTFPDGSAVPGDFGVMTFSALIYKDLEK